MNYNSKFSISQNFIKSILPQMKKSLMQCQQKKGCQKIQEPSFYQQVAEDQIKAIKQEDFKNDYEQISEVLKIEITDGHQQKELNKFMSQSSNIEPFKKKKQEQNLLFAQDHNQGDKKPLKIVNTENTETFYAFYKDLKKNSSINNIIPVNTIVIARSYDQFLWPAIVVKVQLVNQLDYYRRFIYTVNFIGSQISQSLTKRHIIKFNPQNIAKIKRFFDNKKLNKALKIAEKNFNQKCIEKKNKTLQTETLEKMINKRKQIPLSVPIKLYNNQKWKPINLVIETQRIKLQQLIVNNQSQTDSDQEVKDDIQKKSLQKDFCHDETFLSQQGQLSQQMSFKSPFQDNNVLIKNDLIQNKPKKQKQQLQKCGVRQKKYKYQLIYTIQSYIYQWRKQLKEIKPKPKKKLNSGINNLFNFFSLPLTDFKIEYFSRYSNIINSFLLLCTENYLNLKDQERQFIKKSEEVLIEFYHTLKDHEGQSEFIKGLKLLYLYKLKNFKEKVLKTQTKINT